MPLYNADIEVRTIYNTWVWADNVNEAHSLLENYEDLDPTCLDSEIIHMNIEEVKK